MLEQIIQIVVLVVSLTLMGICVFAFYVQDYRGYHSLAFLSCIVLAMLDVVFTIEIGLVWGSFTVVMMVVTTFCVEAERYRLAMFTSFPVAIVTTILATIAFVSGAM